MAISDSDYAGSFSLPTPKGVYQAEGDTNINVNYAYRAENMRTERGLLATAYGVSAAFPSLGAPIGTLERFYRRTRPDDPDVYVAAAGGAIYTYTMGTEGWIQRASGFLSDTWSAITYEALDAGQTVDVLILSNALDGMASNTRLVSVRTWYDNALVAVQVVFAALTVLAAAMYVLNDRKSKKQ